MLFRPSYGRVGWMVLPYMWIFEFFAPVVELVGYSTIVTAFVLGELSQAMISIGSVLLEEMTFRRYSDWREVTRLIFYCFFEHFPYRQLTMFWRLQGIWQYLRGDMRWHDVKRVGISTNPTV